MATLVAAKEKTFITQTKLLYEVTWKTVEQITKKYVVSSNREIEEKEIAKVCRALVDDDSISVSVMNAEKCFRLSWYISRKIKFVKCYLHSGEEDTRERARYFGSVFFLQTRCGTRKPVFIARYLFFLPPLLSPRFTLSSFFNWSFSTISEIGGRTFNKALLRLEGRKNLHGLDLVDSSVSSISTSSQGYGLFFTRRH